MKDSRNLRIWLRAILEQFVDFYFFVRNYFRSFVSWKRKRANPDINQEKCQRSRIQKGVWPNYNMSSFVLVREKVKTIVIPANCRIVLEISSMSAFVCSKQPNIDKWRCGFPRCSTVGWLVVLVASTFPYFLWASLFTSFIWIPLLCHCNIRLVGPGVRWGAIHYNQQYKSLQY